MKSRVIATNFSIRKQCHVPGEKGGKEWVLLRCRQKTGLYIVWCTVEYTKGKTENHNLFLILIFHHGKEKNIMVQLLITGNIQIFEHLRKKI